ncbi:MAG: hypothetical protein WC391_03580 [Methanoregula sp.]|jgi:hypothetical protein
MDFSPSPALVTFITVIVMVVAAMAISRILDRVWARSFPMPLFYYLVSAPGVVVHESAHIAGCLLTGAKIKKVVFFSEKGGSVTYLAPPVPWLGNLIIGTAPLFFIPLVLAVITGIFMQYGGCILPVTSVSLTTPDAFFLLVTTPFFILYQNLIAHFNGWFLLYLYLTVSLVLSLAPSTQDLKNAAAGLLVLTGLGFAIILIDIPATTGLLVEFLLLISTGLFIGLVFELIALIVSLPLAALHR